MMIKIGSLTCFFLFFSCFYSAEASMQDSLERAFQSLGMANNVTGPSSAQDQSGGFYSGGSVFARSPVHYVNLAPLQLPHYRSGCGGIDLFMGGMSYVNAQEFIQLLRNIGSNASGYAFSLALATITPQIKSVLDELSAKVQHMTNQSINSCEAAATLLGGVWPQSDASSQLLCNAMSKDLGQVSDWAESRQRCGAAGQRHEITSQKGQGRAAGYKDVLGDEFNLAWKALKKNAFLSSDKRLSEFFMTISGTLVSRYGEGGILEVKEIPSKSGDQDLIAALLLGGRPVQVYHCEEEHEDKCLNPQLRTEVLPKNIALVERVELLLSSLYKHLLTDKPLTEEQQAFINSTMIPILKIMAVEMAFKEGGAPLSLNTYRDAIAYDILLHYLDEIMALVWESVGHLKQAQLNDKMIESFRHGISETRKLLFSKRTSLFQQISLTLEAIERTQQIERKLQNQFISGGR